MLLTAIGNAAARCIRGEPAVTVTEDELADIIENMTDDGELTAERGELMSSALSFADVPVESVITRAWTSPPWTWTIPRRRSSLRARAAPQPSARVRRQH